MASVNPVLVLKTEENKNYLEIVDIAVDNIPESMNGEARIHIYHARMLT